MKVFVLIAHPRPDSLCHAFARTARDVAMAAGWDVLFHDLYEESFDPILKPTETQTHGFGDADALTSGDDPVLAAHRRDIAAAQALVVVHPNWWGKPPAILAGWIDRVLVPGIAYKLDSGAGLPQGLLQLRAALILNTSDTPAEREREVFGDPLDLMWRRCILPFCGTLTIDRVVFRPVAGSLLAERRAWLSDAAQSVQAMLQVTQAYD